MTTFVTRTLSTLALLAALAVPTALANGALRVDAAAAPFADGADAVGIDLAWDGDLILVLAAEGVGALGDAVVPVVDVDGLPTDALGRVIASEAIDRSGVVVAMPGGLAFLLDGGDDRSAAVDFAQRLTALGFAVDTTNGGRILTFVRDGHTFRASFRAHDAGVQVYLGAL